MVRNGRRRTTDSSPLLTWHRHHHPPSSRHATRDEDINTSATIIPSVDILVPITRSRAQQLNHQVNSFLCSSGYNIESRLLPNDLIALRNQGKDHEGQTEHQEGAEEPRRRHEKVANQSNSKLSSSSLTRSSGPLRIQIDV
jgi:hypothetical protein